MNIIILSNGPGLPEVVSLYGHSSEWIPDSINNKNIKYKVVKTYNNLSFDHSDADAFIITGSKYSVYDDAKWIDNLKVKVNELIKLEKPILGICFGHQILAHCLGASVIKNDKGWELGSYNISLTDKGFKSPLFKGIKNNEIFYESHQDVVTELPIALKELAFTAKANQSFCYNDLVYGVQFHPEFSYDVTKKLVELRVDKGIKVDSQVVDKSIKGKIILDNFIKIVKASIK